MNLGKQIDSLLKRQSSVYVNGLGVFKRVHTPATFDSKRKVFLPPISFIEFDHFEEQGYDFITYLQQVEQIDRLEAMNILNNYVADILDKIHQNGEVVLDNLGTLVSYGNSFVFKPLDLSGFLYVPVEDDYHQVADIQDPADISIILEDTSLEEEHRDPIQAEISKVESAKENPNVPEINNENSKAEPIVVQTIEPVASFTDEVVLEHKESNNAYVYALIAAFALLILGGIYYYMSVNKSSEPNNNLISVEIPINDNIQSSDSLEQSYTDTFSNVLPATDTIVENIVPVAPKEEVIVDHKYIIIIGTHQTLEEAYAQAESFNKKGHKSVRVLMPNMAKNKKRVIWDTYPTREQRDSALREVRKHNKPDAWGAEI